MHKIYGSVSVPEKVIKILDLTSGIYEVFLERSGRKIWVKPEPRAEPYIPCYMRVNGTKWNESAASP